MSTQNDKYLNAAGNFVVEVEMPATGWFAEVGDKCTPCIQLPLRVIDGEQEGKRITHRVWLTDAAFENTLKTLYDCFQFNGDFELLARDPNGFAGMKARIVTEFETYNGEKRCKVKWLNPIDGPGTAAAMDEGKVSSLISRLNKTSKTIVKGFEKAGPKPATSKPTANDDDIPM